MCIMAKITEAEGSAPKASEEFFTAGGTSVYRKTQNGGFVNLETGILFSPDYKCFRPIPVGYKFTVEVDK